MELIKRVLGSATKNLIVSSRTVICEKCNKEIEVRWGIFANQTLSRHYGLEHK